MDALKNIANSVKGSGSGSTTGNQQPTTNAGNEDYLDKGLDAVERKFGGGKIDPAKTRGVNEKITDTSREYFEKVTGKHVPEKFSN